MDGAPRSRLSTLGAIFAFLAAVVVTVLGVVPSAAIPTRQPAASDDPATAESADAETGSVSIAAPDKTDDELQVPGPVGAPVAGLPEASAHAIAKPAVIAGHTGESRPHTTRGRAPPS
ncbi:MAG TPA: hypothetical protein VFY84_16245 [Jiangellales bacterium]|nr:hypothetical protein [Jiangellales bacterium]